jgi:hypothetical protein
MNRRRFFELLGMGVAGIALEQAIPFNRVWSFPKDIVLAKQDFLRDGFFTNDGEFIGTHQLATAKMWYRDDRGNTYYWIRHQTAPIKLSSYLGDSQRHPPLTTKDTCALNAKLAYDTLSI